LSESRLPYVLRRVHPDGSEEAISEHPTFEEGWRAGTHTVTVLDKQRAYSLYANGRCVAKFGHSRLMPSPDTTNVRFGLDLMGCVHHLGNTPIRVGALVTSGCFRPAYSLVSRTRMRLLL
jgi:hypothetical protein